MSEKSSCRADRQKYSAKILLNISPDMFEHLRAEAAVTASNVAVVARRRLALSFARVD